MYHLGDPCIHCKQPHDDVAPGFCAAAKGFAARIRCVELCKGLLNKLNEDFQKLREESNNPALTQEKREQKAKAVNDKVLELRKSLEAVKEFEQNSQQYLNDLRRRQNDTIMKEILEAVRKKGREGAYTMIVDSSGFGTMSNVPMAVYADEKLDFTDVVLKELNVNAPANLPVGSGSKSSPLTLPAPSVAPRTPAPSPAP